MHFLLFLLTFFNSLNYTGQYHTLKKSHTDTYLLPTLYHPSLQPRAAGFSRRGVAEVVQLLATEITAVELVVAGLELDPVEGAAVGAGVVNLYH